jgi:hypothetical protein
MTRTVLETRVEVSKERVKEKVWRERVIGRDVMMVEEIVQGRCREGTFEGCRAAPGASLFLKDGACR